ncbi:MAG: peptidoglycan-associated lipoprotein Pal [Deltaproteobacteria bacterium]|nr:peptidoglycan-associated lipoprotein Pal [Deltaproteobacteria bacterium]
MLAFLLALGAASCSKKQKADEGAESPAGGVGSSDLAQDMSDSDTGRAAGLQTVHYAYDSSVLDSTAKGTLDENARILKEKSSLKVQIEGHCDERGGIQYNIALGERRASVAKAYLVDKGVGADRVTIISYGKEKPVDQGHSEESWAKNRRSNFRITEK